MRRFAFALGIAWLTLLTAPSLGAEWVRGGSDGRQARWGLAGGLQFALPPATPGPRGLIRILYPTLTRAKPSESPPAGSAARDIDAAGYDLINFIAIEPIVGKVRCFSELERSELDRTAGKRLWVEPGELRGEVTKTDDGTECLHVVIHVERFINGAHVRLLAEQRADRPDELSLTIEAEPDSAAIAKCILTATMGNRARTRQLWLKDETISSLKLYPDYRGRNFAPSTSYPLKRLTVTKAGDVVVAITTDEAQPADVYPFPGTKRWYYGGVPVTQYWRKPKGTWRPDLEAVVNARFTYWMSRQPIPGGIAFENFELRARFHPHQQFIFGVSRQTPAQLGVVRQGVADTRSSQE